MLCFLAILLASCQFQLKPESKENLTEQEPQNITEAGLNETKEQELEEQKKEQFTLKFFYERDLKNYPKPFIINGDYDENTLFIVGDTAPASDSLALSLITAGLQSDSNEQILPKLKIVSEVTNKDILENNLVLFGNPCDNKLIELFETKCEDWGLEEGEGLIQFFTHNEKAVIIVSGTIAEDTKMAVEYLAGYKKYKEIGEFEGSEIIIDKSKLNPPEPLANNSYVCGNGICEINATYDEVILQCLHDCCKSDCTMMGRSSCQPSCNGYNGCEGVLIECTKAKLGERRCVNNYSSLATCCSAEEVIPCGEENTCLDWTWEGQEYSSRTNPRCYNCQEMMKGFGRGCGHPATVACKGQYPNCECTVDKVFATWEEIRCFDPNSPANSTNYRTCLFEDVDEGGGRYTRITCPGSEPWPSGPPPPPAEPCIPWSLETGFRVCPS